MLGTERNLSFSKSGRWKENESLFIEMINTNVGTKSLRGDISGI
jgi:hypothetical protein